MCAEEATDLFRPPRRCQSPAPNAPPRPPRSALPRLPPPRPQGIAFAGPAICMVALAVLTPTVPGAGPTGLIVGIMSLAFALGAWARAGLYCNHQDLSPKYAAALLGERAPALPGLPSLLRRVWALLSWLAVHIHVLLGLGPLASRRAGQAPGWLLSDRAGQQARPCTARGGRSAPG